MPQEHTVAALQAQCVAMDNMHGITSSWLHSAADKQQQQQQQPKLQFSMLGRPARKTPVCQVDGCGQDLAGDKFKTYHRRNRICDEHAKCLSCIHKGRSVRYCQQCHKLHDLQEFDFGRHSCRTKLQKRAAAVHRTLNNQPDDEPQGNSALESGGSARANRKRKGDYIYASDEPHELSGRRGGSSSPSDPATTHVLCDSSNWMQGQHVTSAPAANLAPRGDTWAGLQLQLPPSSGWLQAATDMLPPEMQQQHRMQLLQQYSLQQAGTASCQWTAAAEFGGASWSAAQQHNPNDHFGQAGHATPDVILGYPALGGHAKMHAGVDALQQQQQAGQPMALMTGVALGRGSILQQLQAMQQSRGMAQGLGQGQGQDAGSLQAFDAGLIAAAAQQDNMRGLFDQLQQRVHQYRLQEQGHAQLHLTDTLAPRPGDERLNGIVALATWSSPRKANALDAFGAEGSGTALELMMNGEVGAELKMAGGHARVQLPFSFDGVLGAGQAGMKPPCAELGPMGDVMSGLGQGGWAEGILERLVRERQFPSV